MKTQSLHPFWQEIARFFQLSSEDSDRFLEEIKTEYNGHGRYYHNQEHVLSLLTFIDAQRVSKTGRISLLLAAFYHDVIYLPGSSKNEVKSAKLLEKHFDNYKLYPDLIEAASQIIRETKDHESANTLSRLFLDMDLSILGSKPDRYQRYCAEIRKEFANIPEFLYRKGRKQFVKQQLSKPYVFQTEQFRKAFEKQAQENLMNELTCL